MLVDCPGDVRHEPVSPHYLISQNGQEPVVCVDSIEQVERTIRSSPPGRYQLDDISTEPLPSAHSARRWDVAIRHADGSVDLEPDRWET